jgi:anti-anti-sigma factor
MNGKIFDMEKDGDTLILVPVRDMPEPVYQAIEEGARDVLHLIEQVGIKNVVLDFRRTDYFGSTALGFFVRLWKRISARQGKMAFCNVSEHEMDILRLTRLDKLWPICSSREEALQVIQ